MALVFARFQLDPRLRGRYSYFHVERIITAFKAGRRACPYRDESGNECKGTLQEVAVKDVKQVDAAKKKFPKADTLVQIGCNTYHGKTRPGCGLMIPWWHYMPVIDAEHPLADETVYCPAVDRRRVYASVQDWEDAFQRKMRTLPIPGADADDDDGTHDKKTDDEDDDDDGHSASSRRHSSSSSKSYLRTDQDDLSPTGDHHRRVGLGSKYSSSSSSSFSSRDCRIVATQDLFTSSGSSGGSAGGSKQSTAQSGRAFVEGPSSSLSAPRGEPMTVDRRAKSSNSSGGAKMTRDLPVLHGSDGTGASGDADIGDDGDGDVEIIGRPRTPPRSIKRESRKRTLHADNEV